MFEKGQSKRIWAELYKVIDSSDVVIQVNTILSQSMSQHPLNKNSKAVLYHALPPSKGLLLSKICSILEHSSYAAEKFEKTISPSERYLCH